MEFLALIPVIGLAGAVLAFLLLRRHKPRSRHDFLDNPNEWGW